MGTKSGRNRHSLSTYCVPAPVILSQARTVGLLLSSSHESRVPRMQECLTLSFTGVSPAAGTWWVYCCAFSLWKEMDATRNKHLSHLPVFMWPEKSRAEAEPQPAWFRSPDSSRCVGMGSPALMSGTGWVSPWCFGPTGTCVLRDGSCLSLLSSFPLTLSQALQSLHLNAVVWFINMDGESS